MEQDIWRREFPLSNPQLRRKYVDSNASLEYLSPAAERETKNLPNFFPLPHLPEEEGVLAPKVEEWRVPLPEAGLKDWGPGVSKLGTAEPTGKTDFLVEFLSDFSKEIALWMASLWRILLVFSCVSLGNNSDKPERSIP